ncbi:MAG: hypothetical protein KDJ69_04860 [Nitratireductor sp.]|nr:hypothetical protein [Nitratireductor sp.]
MAARQRETDLYEPVKRLLEGQGYAVKAEVGAADVVGLRGDEPPVIVELKTGFSLILFHQAIARLKVTDAVYVAVPEWKGRAGWKAFVANRTLCRRLGLGLITVQVETGVAQVHLDPGPYAPRQSKVRRERLLREFQHRVGDPNTGGSAQTTLMTSYRQDALRCLKTLNENGPTKAAEVAQAAGVSRARTIMADDHYGWFERVERGIYAITPKGENAIDEYSHVLEELE